MNDIQLVVSEKEMGLLLDLLRQEQQELPSELRHTTRAEYAAGLRERRATVDGLIDRLQAASARTIPSTQRTEGLTHPA